MGAAGLAEQLQLGDHLCWTFDNDDHRWNTTAELIAAGIDAGHKVLYLTDLLPPPALLAGLDERGVPARHAERVGQFEVLPAQRAYLSGGRFDPDRVLGMLSERIEQAGADGYPGLQVIGDMGWAVADPPDADLLTRYESEANRLVLDGQALAICVYDRRAFDREVLHGVASAHPAGASHVDFDLDWVPLLRVQRTGEPYGLRLVGEADLTNRQALVAAVDTVVGEAPDPATPVVIDVSGLRFADAATGGLLARAAQRAPAGLHVVGCQGVIAVVLDRLGVAEMPGVRISTAAPAGIERTA